MWLLFLFSVSISSNSKLFSAAQECTWSVTVNDEEYKLDLRQIRDVPIIWIDPTGVYLNYTACSNGAVCYSNNENGMSVQTYSDECYILSVWDESVQPQYDINENSFSFTYENGDQCFGSPRIFSTTWICDPLVETYVSYVNETVTCQYEMVIRSKYGCPSHNSTTCKWTTIDGQKSLDLSALSGKVYTGTNSNNNSELFTISPCQNALSCGTGIEAMSTIVDVSNFECLAYLAVWDYGINPPIYNENQRFWQFVYQNGQQVENCSGDIVYIMDWYCNENVATAMVTAAREISDCVFQILIDSIYAC